MLTKRAMDHFLRDTGFRIAVHLKREREGDRGGGEKERELSHENRSWRMGGVQETVN